MASATLRTQVLVVGAGPAGAILALELAHHNVASLVVERDTTPPRYPDVDVLTGRGMELLRRLDLVTRIRRHGVAPDDPAGLEWSQGLDQPPVLTVQCPSVDQLRGRYADVNDGSAPVEPHQRVLGARLAEQLRDAARCHPLVDLREGWTFTDLRVESDGSVAGLLDRTRGVRHFVKAAHVVGCDGAQSTVRRCLDVAMDQLEPAARHCSVHFRSADPGLLARERTLATIVVGGRALVQRGDRDAWVGHLPVACDEPIATDPVAMLRSRLGIGPELLEVLGVRQWDDSLAIAARYRRGQVYLAGEAAHRFHPVGTGLDVSLGDAVDLGWKLAAVINGWGGPTLLDSYELERRPRAVLERETLVRASEARRRFGGLTAAGAAREFLTGLLRQESALIDDLGIRVGGRYASSSVICAERGAPPETPTTWPGGRAPAVRLADGSQLFDRLGPELTLVDLTDGGAGRPLVTAANRRGIPMTHLTVTDPAVLACWDRPLVLVRPDHHVAWRAGRVPDDWHSVLDLVSGLSGLGAHKDHVDA